MLDDVDKLAIVPVMLGVARRILTARHPRTHASSQAYSHACSDRHRIASPRTILHRYALYASHVLLTSQASHRMTSHRVSCIACIVHTQCRRFMHTCLHRGCRSRKLLEHARLRPKLSRSCRLATFAKRSCRAHGDHITTPLPTPPCMHGRTHGRMAACIASRTHPRTHARMHTCT